MAVRAWIFAALLLLAGALIIRGAYLLDPAVGWIVAGVAVAGWSWLILGEVPDREVP